MRNCFLLKILLACLPAQAQNFPVPEKCLTNHPANDRYASYSPDGKQILFESDRNGNWDIFLMDRNGENVQALTDNTADDRQASWFPDGKKILFESMRSGQNEFYTYSLESGKVEKAMATDIPAGTPQFGRIAPDGSQFVFTLQENDSTFHLFLYNFNRRTIHKLSAGNFRFAYANWSPKGNMLVLHARHETENMVDEIYTLRLGNRRWRRLTNTPEHSFCPAWSNSGKFIAYAQSMKNTRPEIYIMNNRGKKQRRITQNADGDTLPTFSPDDNYLLITAYRNGNFEICEIRLN